MNNDEILEVGEGAVTEDALANLLHAKNAAKLAKDAYYTLREEVVGAMAETGSSELHHKGKKVATYKSYKRLSIDKKKLQDEFPEIYNRYLLKKEFFSLRILA